MDRLAVHGRRGPGGKGGVEREVGGGVEETVPSDEVAAFHEHVPQAYYRHHP